MSIQTTCTGVGERLRDDSDSERRCIEGEKRQQHHMTRGSTAGRTSAYSKKGREGMSIISKVKANANQPGQETKTEPKILSATTKSKACSESESESESVSAHSSIEEEQGRSDLYVPWQEACVKPPHARRGWCIGVPQRRGRMPPSRRAWTVTHLELRSRGRPHRPPLAPSHGRSARRALVPADT